MASKSGFLPALTGLRGIAVVWIVLNQVWANAPALLGHHVSSALFERGYFGVDLFFILSGFIITHIHYKDFESSFAQNLRPFLVLRAFRVYPLHVAVMLILLATVVLLPDFADYQMARENVPYEYEPIPFVVSIFLVQGGFYKFFPSWNGPSWTISALLLAYLAFPLIVRCVQLTKKPAVHLCLALTLLTGFGFVMQYLGLLDWSEAGPDGIARALVGFTAGCLLNRFYMQSRNTFPPFLMVLLSLGIIMLAVSFEALRPFIYLGLGLLVLSLAYGPALFRDLLGKSVVFWLGQISFSLYLTHALVINLTCWIGDGWLPHVGATQQAIMICAMFVAILLVAAAAFRYIESPARLYGRRVAAAHSLEN